MSWANICEHGVEVVILLSIRDLSLCVAASCPSLFTTPLSSMCSRRVSGGDESRSSLAMCIAWKIDPYFVGQNNLCVHQNLGFVQISRHFLWKSSPNKGKFKRCDVRIMVDFPAPAHPATMNKVSKYFLWSLWIFRSWMRFFDGLYWCYRVWLINDKPDRKFL